jgi:hypothetical protein
MEAKLDPFQWAFLLSATLLLSLTASSQSSFQRLTPSFVLDSGVFEGKVFNDLYTQNAFFDASKERVELSRRSSFLTNIGQFLYGIGHGVNLGIEAWGSSVRIGTSDRSPFHLLQGGPGMGRRSSLSYLGPRIKFAPVEAWTSTSMELTLLAPIAPDLEGRKRETPFLAEDRYSAILKFFYDRELTRDLRLFIRFAPWLSIDRYGRRDESYFSSPISAFLSYIPTPRLTFYSQSEWWPTYGRAPLISSSFFQQGLGVKYMLIEDRLEGEVLYSRFLFGKNSGAGESFDLGVRLLLGN